MQFFRRFHKAPLFFFLTSALAAAYSANAASNQFRVKISSVPEFVAESVHTGATTPGVSGRASGRREHGSIIIVKRLDRASPLLRQAMLKNSRLSEVLIEDVANVGGREQVVRTMRLRNALVAKISEAARPGGPAQNETEQVTLVYEQIEITGNKGKTTAADDWEARQ